MRRWSGTAPRAAAAYASTQRASMCTRTLTTTICCAAQPHLVVGRDARALLRRYARNAVAEIAMALAGAALPALVVYNVVDALTGRAALAGEHFCRRATDLVLPGAVAAARVNAPTLAPTMTFSARTHLARATERVATHLANIAALQRTLAEHGPPPGVASAGAPTMRRPISSRARGVTWVGVESLPR